MSDAAILSLEGADSPLLRPLLLAPALVWTIEALQKTGTTHFCVLCDQDLVSTVAPLLPPGAILPTSQDDSQWTAFQSAHPDTPVQRHPCALLTPLGGGEPALQTLDSENPAVWLDYQAQAKATMVARLLAQGVFLTDSQSVYVDPTVTVGQGTTLLPGTLLRGNTTIGKACVIGPNTMIQDSTLGDGVHANATQIVESTVADGANIGPFAYIRPNCHIGPRVKVGDFVEVKNATVGEGTKIPHLTYVGDADVGAHVNFGCGTVFVNYNGAEKFRSTIGDNAFVGCNTNLVSPVTLGKGAYTAAGSTITQDVPAETLAIARARQVNKETWARPVKAKK